MSWSGAGQEGQQASFRVVRGRPAGPRALSALTLALPSSGPPTLPPPTATHHTPSAASSPHRGRGRAGSARAQGLQLLRPAHSCSPLSQAPHRPSRRRACPAVTASPTPGPRPTPRALGRPVQLRARGRRCGQSGSEGPEHGTARYACRGGDLVRRAGLGFLVPRRQLLDEGWILVPLVPQLTPSSSTSSTSSTTPHTRCRHAE